MEICYIPENMDGSGCYRCLFPADALSMLGGHHTFLPPYSRENESEKHLTVKWHTEAFPMDADLYVFQTPTSRYWYALIKQLQRNQKKVIVELDDDLQNLEESNPALKGTAPPIGRAGDHNRVILQHCVRAADAVTVSTPAIKESYSKVTRKPIHVLRNYLDWRMWRDVTPAHERPNPRGRVRVGYLGTLQWHTGDLSTLNPWFGEWVAAHPDVDFVAAGDNTVHDFLGIPDHQRVSTDGVSFRHLELADIVASFDIGIVPLERNLFNEAKSHLKGMEYAGAGVPCVATPSESYRDWWLPGSGRGGRAGLLAVGPGEWVRHLDSLATDGTLRESMGVAARKLAEQNTIQEHWTQWEEVYENVLHYNPVNARA